MSCLFSLNMLSSACVRLSTFAAPLGGQRLAPQDSVGKSIGPSHSWQWSISIDVQSRAVCIIICIINFYVWAERV